MNEYARLEITFARDQLGKPYKFGAHGPDKWDCVGLVTKSARAAGLDTSVVPASWTVRNLTNWARNHGRLRLADSGYVPKRGDIFIWGKADGDHAPVIGAGHTGFVLRPVSAKHPRGKAISAYNPEKGVITHDLIPTGHLGLYGYIEQDFPAPVVVPEPPYEEPEPPPPSDAAGEQVGEPDDDLLAENLQLAADLVECGQAKVQLQDENDALRTKIAAAQEVLA